MTGPMVTRCTVTQDGVRCPAVGDEQIDDDLVDEVNANWTDTGDQVLVLTQVDGEAFICSPHLNMVTEF